MEPDVHNERVTIACIGAGLAVAVLVRLVGGPPFSGLVLGTIAFILVRRGLEGRRRTP